MTERQHWSLRIGALLLSVLIPALFVQVLRPTAPNVPPRPSPQLKPAPPTPGIGKLRPLFSVPMDVADDGDRPRLVGVAGRLPDDAVALVRLGDSAAVVMKPGELVGGWRLEAVASEQAVFSRSGRQFVSTLDPAP